jgi:chemotaxis protein methyltransferase CheR
MSAGERTARGGEVGRPLPGPADALGELMDLVSTVAGILLPEAKRPMVEVRLAKRLRNLNLDLAGYMALVRTDADEQHRLIDLVSTNHTAWWREAPHFEDLAQRVLPMLLRRPAPRRLRIWCAAAATGEEAYSIALCLAKAIAREDDAAILATDISTHALAKARQAQYQEAAVSALAPSDRALALSGSVVDGATLWTVRPELRRLVQFARLNLQDDWPMRGPFEVIFCRNVMIYFSVATQQRLVTRLSALLAPGGTLYVGHSESLTGVTHHLRRLQPSIYTAP